MSNEGTTRRDVVQGGAMIAAAAASSDHILRTRPVGEAFAHGADLEWLGGLPAQTDMGLVWGTPWPRGAHARASSFRLSAADGRSIPVQTWPLAYWPDGSLKWTGHAATGPISATALRLEPGAPARPSAPVAARTAGDAIVLSTGEFRVTLPRSGAVLIRAATLNGKSQIENAKLVCLRQDRSQIDTGVVRTERFESRIEAAIIEQAGPVRAVVRLQGVHASGSRAWLPFTVRISLHAGARGVKLTHSFIFDGDATIDFIGGLGLVFEAPQNDELHNRHVRFGGEGEGLWGEAVRNIPGWAPRFAHADKFADQLDGKPVLPLAQMSQQSRDQLATVPAWEGFKLFQSSADRFDVTKRTVPVASWLQTDHGKRASGLGYLGGISGGVVFGLRDFWQRHPTALEIHDATSDRAKVSLWFWSPEAPAMDLRHYSDRAHGLEIQYEDVEPGFSTPLGVARTSEVHLWCTSATPSRVELTKYAAELRAPPLLVSGPQRYRALDLFGPWGLPDRSTPVKARLEDEHDKLIAFYLNEIDRRSWYGFWSYGDVMHTYDKDRHAWRYDVGGYAWANSELVPDLWLWTAFLRSGRADIFRMAEAMTRHTGEVDVYHLGRFAKLGSRHNVSHWGCGAKEARISQALLRRIYYYLTADERVGDLMREVVTADETVGQIDPLRHVLPPSQYPTHARSGPDWFAFASNWLVEWERTGDTHWRDKIVHGFNTIAAMPLGMFAGPAFGYDPATATLHPIGGDLTSSYHLVSIFGGAELMMELHGLIDAPAFDATWLKFCELYNASAETRAAQLGHAAPDNIFGFPIWHARLTAYAALRNSDPALAERAWNEFLYGFMRDTDRRFPIEKHRIAAPAALEPIDEISWIETNHASQWSLNLFALMGLAGAHAPASLHAPWPNT